MRAVFIQLNSAFKSLFNWCPDRRVHRSVPENLCCLKVKEFGFLTWPEKGIVRLNINYCFVCGRKLDRRGAGGLD